MSVTFPRPDIPIYSNPPVTEMLLSIQFATLPAFRSYHVGLLWSQLRREYPTISEQAPLGAVFETFGVSSPHTGLFPLGMLLGTQMSRFWLESADGIDVLQIQQDRIIHNWRQRNGAVYPH